MTITIEFGVRNTLQFLLPGDCYKERMEVELWVIESDTSFHENLTSLKPGSKQMISFSNFGSREVLVA